MARKMVLMSLLAPLATFALLALPLQARAANDDEVLKDMEAAKMTLTKAVDTAEKASKGKAVAVHAKMEGKTGTIFVYCMVSGKNMEVPVEIKTGTAGKITEATAKNEKAEHVTKGADILKKLDDDKFTLNRAIEAAELSSKGKAISVKPKIDGDKLDLMVKCCAAEKWYNVTVDAKTGKVTKTDELKAEKKHEDKKTGTQKTDTTGGKKP